MSDLFEILSKFFQGGALSFAEFITFLWLFSLFMWGVTYVALRSAETKIILKQEQMLKEYNEAMQSIGTAMTAIQMVLAEYKELTCLITYATFSKHLANHTCMMNHSSLR